MQKQILAATLSFLIISLSACSSDGWKTAGDFGKIITANNSDSPSESLEEAGKNVSVAESFSLSDSMSFTESLKVTCSRKTADGLINCLRNRAGRNSAVAIIITEKKPDICQSGEAAPTGKCFYGAAKTYIRKQPSP